MSTSEDVLILYFSGIHKNTIITHVKYSGSLTVQSDKGEVHGSSRVLKLDVGTPGSEPVQVSDAGVLTNLAVHPGELATLVLEEQTGPIYVTNISIPVNIEISRSRRGAKVPVEGTVSCRQGSYAIDDVMFRGTFVPSSNLEKTADSFEDPSMEKNAGTETVIEETPENSPPPSVKEAAGGLYGHTKKVQADCEACIRKAQRSASGIARRIYGKDERVASFLATHAKRAHSLPAKILMSAMEGLGPKFASGDPDVMKRQARLEELRLSRLVVADDTTVMAGRITFPSGGLDSFRSGDTLVFTGHGWNARFEIISVHELDSRNARLKLHVFFSDEPWTLYLSGSFKGRLMNDGMPVEYKTVRKLASTTTASVTLTPKDKKVIDAFLEEEAADSKNLTTDGKTLDGNWMGGSGIAEWVDGKIEFHDLGSKSAEIVQNAVKRSAPKNMLKTAGAPTHGLYGFTDKTATSGLRACAELRAATGRVAADLHKRRAAGHGAITGFLQSHCKSTKCMYAKLLTDSYPSADAKYASAVPKTVAEWLAVEV